MEILDGVARKHRIAEKRLGWRREKMNWKFKSLSTNGA